MSLTTPLQNFKLCVSESPEISFTEAKALAKVIETTCNDLILNISGLGLTAINCDLIDDVESAIYDYVRLSNLGNPIFKETEQFGDSLDGC